MMSNESEELGPLQQAGAVPFRTRGGQHEFLLITSARGGRWGFPKGIIDPGETAIETALKESYEEAGVRGDIVGEPLGCYEYHKWRRTLYVTVYLMRVTSVEDDWQEAAIRSRKWATAAEARELLDRAKLRQMFEAAITRLSGE